MAPELHGSLDQAKVCASRQPTGEGVAKAETKMPASMTWRGKSHDSSGLACPSAEHGQSAKVPATASRFQPVGGLSQAIKPIAETQPFRIVNSKRPIEPSH